MIRRLMLPACLTLLIISDLSAQLPLKDDPDFKIQTRTELAAYPFPLQQVRLEESPFLQAVRRNAEYLLRLEPDRLLHNFRKFAGLDPKGEVYGGWEQDTIAGHTLGHYLTACSLMYAQTGDQRFRDRVDYIVGELKQCQDAAGDGFVAGFPRAREAFEEIKRGEIHSRSFYLNGIWVPFYNWHKLLTGLIDAQRLCRNTAALEIAEKLTGFISPVLGPLTEEQMQQVLVCEHGGINESLANLYAMTGEAAYFRLAKRFYHQAILDPLAAQKDQLAGNHANTQIPKIIGVARLFELTAEPSFRTISSFFWDTVTQHHSYVVGGNSDREYFQEPGMVGKHITEQTCETCNTYNMLKLTRHLFSWDGDSRRIDYYERALYNQILAQQNPATGMVCYMLPLRSGSARRYSTPFDSFWCCVGSGIENHSKYGDTIYFHDGSDSLFVNLFIPSTLTWQEKGLRLEQWTRYPSTNQTKLEFSLTEATRLRLLIRHPGWSKQALELRINGETVVASPVERGFVPVDRLWRDGDVIEVTIPMELRMEGASGDPRKSALLYGPVVLAGDLGSDQDEWNGPAPSLVAEDVLERIQRVDNEPLTFQTADLIRPADLELKPLYQLHDRRYAVYWDRFTPGEWDDYQAEFRAAQARLKEEEAQALDIIRLGDSESELNHNLQSEISWPSTYRGRNCRDARSGGFFSFEANVAGGEPTRLFATYWGGERNRAFEILVDGTKIAYQELDNERPGDFIELSYDIPESLTKGKSKVTIRFEPLQDRTAGPVFGCRVSRR